MKNRRSVRALDLAKLSMSEVKCTDLRSRAPGKGVIAGVSLNIDDEYPSQKIPGVVRARRHTHMVNGWKEKKILGYESYAVRAFVSEPLQCGNCKGYDHVSNVCRWEKYDIEESVNGKCCNCGGDYTPDFLEWSC
jgi:hypothetical protein